MSHSPGCMLSQAWDLGEWEAIGGCTCFEIQDSKRLDGKTGRKHPVPAPRCAHSWGPRVVEMLADRTQHVHVHCCTKPDGHINNRHLCRCGETIVKRKAKGEANADH